MTLKSRQKKNHKKKLILPLRVVLKIMYLHTTINGEDI